MLTLTATYSPEDNKLRLYASARLDPETYERVRAAGFAWAPKQDLFVAPMWTPGRADLLTELCGDIDDEDTSLCERAEQRADRFDDYSGKRAKDAERAHSAVRTMADGIPFGQPILVGHHSERRARKDAERIENGMRKAVKMWETADYWRSRAAGAVAAAKYKELPAVRARRIKGLEADLRKFTKERDRFAALLALWQKLHEPGSLTRKDGTETTFWQRATHVANMADDMSSRCYPLADFPRNPPASQYEGQMSMWSALGGGDEAAAIITPEQAQAMRLQRLPPNIENRNRWIAHTEHRLAYERAMLGESGYVEPPKAATKAVLPLLNYRGDVTLKGMYGNPPQTMPTRDMTKAEFSRINQDYKGTRLAADGSHRIRIAYVGGKYSPIFLTDSKEHPRPGAIAPGAETDAQEAVAARIAKAQDTIAQRNAARAAAKAANAELLRPQEARPAAVDVPDLRAMKDQLKAGVTVVVAPQLFPTPRDLAAELVALAEIPPSARVLEPSAGTGVLLDAIGAHPGEVVAVEINPRLAQGLRERSLTTQVQCRDFLFCNGDLGRFDRIIMNPPFGGAQDIAHIRHAVAMLKPGGRLVAVCANGPRQREALQPLATEWRDLPAGTFAEQGTNVNTAVVVIDAA